VFGGDPILTEILDFFTSWTGLALTLSVILAFAIVRLSVTHAAKTRPGAVAFALLPIVALLLFLAGQIDWSVLLLLMFAFVVVVVLTSRRGRARGRSRRRSDEAHAGE